MFEVTVVLSRMNSFHRGCLSARNARHGYAGRVRDFVPQGQTGGKKTPGLVVTEIDANLWPVFGQGQNLAATLCKERLRRSKRDGR